MITGYLFVFYKFQSKIFTFFPSQADEADRYWYYRIIFWSDVISFIAYMALQVFEQTNVDIYMIDWEKQTMQNEMGKKDLKGNVISKVDLSSGSCWRTLFIANEFNEMWGSRYISLEMVFLIFIVFMKGFEWENYSAITSFMTKDIRNLELNYILKFFLSSFILVFVACLNYGTY